MTGKVVALVPLWLGLGTVVGAAVKAVLSIGLLEMLDTDCSLFSLLVFFSHFLLFPLSTSVIINPFTVLPFNTCASLFLF